MTDLTDDPEVVCLCGSTRFKDQYRAENRRLTMAGKIVLSVGLFGHADGHEFTDEEKEMLDVLHKRKIDLADRIHVINVGGYIGDSTQSEIEYARETGTKITYLEQPVATDGGTTLTLPSDALESIRDEMPDDALSTETETRIEEICAALDTHQYASGCSPRSLASAAVYAAALALNDTYTSDYTISQRTVAEWGGVSRGSVRTHYKAVMAVWAEENADQLTADQRRAYSEHWGAEIDVPKREIRTDGGTLKRRRGEYTVDLRDTEFGRVLSHGLDGLCLFMARANGGWKPLEWYRTKSDDTVRNGAKHPTLSHQTYAKDVETYLEHNPETLEVAVVDLDAGDWQTVWVRDGEDQLADHRSNDEGGDGQ